MGPRVLNLNSENHHSSLRIVHRCPFTKKIGQKDQALRTGNRESIFDQCTTVGFDPFHVFCKPGKQHCTIVGSTTNNIGRLVQPVVKDSGLTIVLIGRGCHPHGAIRTNRVLPLTTNTSPRSMAPEPKWARHPSLAPMTNGRSAEIPSCFATATETPENFVVVGTSRESRSSPIATSSSASDDHASCR